MTRRWPLLCAGAFLGLTLSCRDNGPVVDARVSDRSPRGDQQSPRDGQPDTSAAASCDEVCEIEAAHLCVALPQEEKCVECLLDNHCRRNPGALGPRCDGRNQVCTCDADDECAANANGKKCHAQQHLCSCESDKDCPSSLRCTPVTLGPITARVCRAVCHSDGDCASPSRPRCDLGSGSCVACLGLGDCAASASGAICAQSSCGCGSDGDCSGPTAWGGRCESSPPEGGSRRCGCRSEVECAGNEHGSVCTEARKCGCATDGDCSVSPYTRCGPRWLGSSHRECQRPCASDADCALRPGLPHCSSSLKKCVVCATDEDCGTGGHCQLISGECVSCKTDADCRRDPGPEERGKYCHSELGQCVPCRSDEDCVRDGSAGGPYCNGHLGECVACRTDQQCSKREAPACDPLRGECVTCVTDAHCQAGLDGALCRSGACGCQGDGDCAGYRWGTKCLAGAGRCGCTTDGDCGATGSGPRCRADIQRCTCADDTDCAQTPRRVCGLPYATAEYLDCQSPCSSDAECSSSTSLGRCDSSSDRCVACLADSDCAGGVDRFCGPVGKCLACRSAKDCPAALWPMVCHPVLGCAECIRGSDCGPESLGNRCGDGVCRCTGDLDCLGNQNGRRCDPTLAVCSCAVSADCPTGKTCSGTLLSAKICR